MYITTRIFSISAGSCVCIPTHLLTHVSKKMVNAYTRQKKKNCIPSLSHEDMTKVKMFKFNSPRYKAQIKDVNNLRQKFRHLIFFPHLNFPKI